MGIMDKIQLWASRRAWAKFTRAPDIPPEMQTVINGCLIPLCVNPVLWMDNTIWLETQGMPQIQGINNLCPTSSVKEFTRRMDRPNGFPEWFLAAFPDVASWAALEAADRSFKQDARALALQENLIARYETLYPGDNPETPDGKLSLYYLKNLAEFYSNCVGRRPECRL